MHKSTKARIEAALPDLLETPQNQVSCYGMIYWADPADLEIYGTPAGKDARRRRIARIQGDHILPYDERRPEDTPVITAAVIKGGTGKTSTIAALAQAAAKDGKNVLAIDLDPQGNLSYTLAGDFDRPGICELLRDTAGPDDMIQQRAGIDLIVSSADLAEIDVPTHRLRGAIKPIRPYYDLVLIDTPPQMGLLTYSALAASSGLIIPLEADRYSMDGLYNIVDIAERFAAADDHTGTGLQILGTVITRYNQRTRLARIWRDAIEQTGEDLGAPLLGVIRPAVALQEAQAMQRSLYDYAPASKPALDYMEIYHRIMKGANHGKE